LENVYKYREVFILIILRTERSWASHPNIYIVQLLPKQSCHHPSTNRPGLKSMQDKSNQLNYGDTKREHPIYST